MMVSKALRFTLYRRRPRNSIFRSNSLYTLHTSQVMGINGWSFSKERCTQECVHRSSYYTSGPRDFPVFLPKFWIFGILYKFTPQIQSPGKMPRKSHRRKSGPLGGDPVSPSFGTALRGGKGSCRADLSTGRLRHSCHSAPPSRTWWNVFLIGNAKISGHLPLPRSYIFPLFLQILLPGRKCVF